MCCSGIPQATCIWLMRAAGEHILSGYARGLVRVHLFQAKVLRSGQDGLGWAGLAGGRGDTQADVALRG